MMEEMGLECEKGRGWAGRTRDTDGTEDKYTDEFSHKLWCEEVVWKTSAYMRELY
jgi:hypothetical protein